MNFTAIVIDDEPYVLKDFKETVKPLKGLIVLKLCSSVDEAFIYLQQNGPVHFIFCDVQMPEISGIEAGKVLSESCEMLVYITGFSGYSLEAFGAGVRGYLMKPIRVEEVLQLMNDLSKMKKSARSRQKQPPEFIKVKTLRDNAPVEVAVKDILLISTCDNYVEVYTEKKNFFKYSTLKEMEETLCPSGEFNRISQSAIIAFKAIKSTTNVSVTLLNGDTLPISRARKHSFFERYYSGAY